MTKLFLLLALAFATPVAAQNTPMAPAPVCPQDAESIPPAFAAWGTRTPLVASPDAASPPGAIARIGTGYDLTLASSDAVQYAVRPTRPVAPGTHGGMVRFTVGDAGTYRVAIGAAAWVDVVSGATALTSSGHGRGPKCSGIRKIVDFALKPGSYMLQIVGNVAATLPVLIVRAR